MRSFCKKIFSLGALVCLFLPAFAEYNKAGIPDSAEIRRTIIDSWLTAPYSEVRTKKNAVKKNDVGIPFEIRMEEHDSVFDIVVAPVKKISLEVINGSKRTVTETDTYPLGLPGSWVLHRNKSDGKPAGIDWYFAEDPGIRLQFRPVRNKTFVDLQVFTFYAARSVPMGISFERLYASSFEDIQKYTLRSLPWNKIAVVPDQYASAIQTAEIIRSKLPLMDYVEDACYNEKGELCAISTAKTFVPEEDQVIDFERINLSGAGFVKYIVDGIVEQYTGTGTKIRELTEPTMSFEELGKNGVMAQDWNLTFTLDWVRNLAAQALSARSSRTYTAQNGGVDVTVEPFAADMVDGKLVNPAGYIKNTGYSVSSLKSLMYVLASTEPSWMYLAAIRQPSESLDGALVFNNCAVFIPFFDGKGRFACAVFENCEEISLDKFIQNNKDVYVHLERVKTTEYFYPR